MCYPFAKGSDGCGHRRIRKPFVLCDASVLGYAIMCCPFGKRSGGGVHRRILKFHYVCDVSVLSAA